ncbi:sigma-E processing peptidase SpoIIGA [Eubacteriales bacterium OttesenSCG-928-M02]|nr:sigma-E processing peptidase SpoIIGA [Eubacteriales bacterium OttesenSCG-928-M02]
MRVYIEVVILDNFLIDFLLLSAAGAFLPSQKKRRFLVLASGVGTAYAVLTPLRGFLFLQHPILKLLVGAILVFLAFGYGGYALYAKRLLLFFLFSFLLGGAIIALGSLLGKPVVAQGGYMVSGLPLWLLLLSAFFLLKGAVVLARRVKERMLGQESTLFLSIQIMGRSIPLSAMVDSGNGLVEPISGRPIVVAKKASILGCLPEGALKDKTRPIPFSSVGGDGTLSVFSPDSICLYPGTEKECMVDGVIALAPGLDGPFDALVPPTLL